MRNLRPDRDGFTFIAIQFDLSGSSDSSKVFGSFTDTISKAHLLSIFLRYVQYAVCLPIASMTTSDKMDVS